MEETRTTQTETHATAVHTHGEPRASLVSNTLAIVGFIIVIVIVLWGLFHIATLGEPWFSSLFDTGSNPIKVTAPANVTSGTAFAVSWKYSTLDKGSYAFLYQCRDTAHFETPGAGGALNSVPCGAAFTVATNNNTLMVTPQLSGTTSTSVPLTIVFIPSATSSKQVQGSASVIVNPRISGSLVMSSIATSTTPAPTKPIVTPQIHPAGPSDLSVQIISVVPDGAGGAIATFDIGNVGQSSTGVYDFTAQLPTADGYLYRSPLQSSLAPGEHIVNTLRFSQAESGVFSVVVDLASTKYESSTDNNYASRTISMPYTPPTYPQPYYPYQQSYVY